MNVSTTIEIDKGYRIEIEATMKRDNARDPIRGESEWLMDDGPWALGPRGKAPLVERYHSKAASALADAANRHEDDDEDDDISNDSDDIEDSEDGDDDDAEEEDDEEDGDEEEGSE